MKLGLCYCSKIRGQFGISANCEWCAIRQERKRLAVKIRGAVPVPFHATTEAQKAAFGLIAEVLFRLAREIERGDD